LSTVPTYQYVCTQCDEALEVHQAFTDEPLTVCPVCQGRLRKVFNAVGVVFKGSGFYRTDSRSSTTATSPAASSGSGSSDSSGEGSGTTTKSDPKPESKPAAAAAASTSSD
jgi:putative FmdB family regulatory protein